MRAQRLLALALTIPAAVTILTPATGRPAVKVFYVLRATSSGRASQPACPRATTCASYQLRKARWPIDGTGRATIRVFYNDHGRRSARAPDGIAQPSLRAAMSEWNGWNSNIVFRDAGTTNATWGYDAPGRKCGDGINVITWEAFDRDVIGAAVVCYDNAGRTITDADLALNNTAHFERVSGTPESRHSHDIQSIYTHELGHWLSLEDLYSADAKKQTMYGTTDYGETNKRTAALGDIAGVQKAYPCSSGDRCPRSGIADD
jgi:hypothetical protein